MTRLLRALAAFGAIVSTLGTLFVTHLPAPSAVDEASRDTVRGVWQGLGEFAKRLPDLPELFDPIRSDKTIHLLIFVPPAALWALAAGRRLDTRRALMLWAALATWGGLDELSQHLTGRNGEWGDWVANMAGAAIGILVVRPVVWLRRAPSGYGRSPP